MLLMAVLMAFSFSACGDDDDDEDQPASIVGTQWYSANDVNGQILSYTIFSFRQGGMLDAEHLIIENGKWYKGLSHRYPYSINGNKISENLVLLAPKDGTTRAQFSVIMQRFLQ